MKEAKENTLWSGTFILLIAMTLLNSTAGMMTVPLVAKYAKELGVDITLASTVAGLVLILVQFLTERKTKSA